MYLSAFTAIATGYGIPRETVLIDIHANLALALIVLLKVNPVITTLPIGYRILAITKYDKCHFPIVTFALSLVFIAAQFLGNDEVIVGGWGLVYAGASHFL